METANLVQNLEHTAARPLIAAEQDRAHRDDMRSLAARLQAMTDELEPQAAT